MARRSSDFSRRSATRPFKWCRSTKSPAGSRRAAATACANRGDGKVSLSGLRRIRDDDDQILRSDLFEAVGAARARENRRAGTDRALLAIERQLARPAQHVVHLVDLLLVQTD